MSVNATRLTDEEIAGLLQEVANGAPVEAVCSGAHVSIRTFYRWKRKFGGLAPAGVRQLRALHAENRELRRLLAERSPLPPPGDAGLRAPAGSGAKTGGADLSGREMHGLALGRFAAVRLPHLT